MITTLATIAMLTLSAADDLPAEALFDSTFDGYTNRRHFEIAMGFIAGVRDETRAGYAFSSGSAEMIPQAQALTAPFALAPYDRTIVYGLGWEARYVTPSASRSARRSRSRASA